MDSIKIWNEIVYKIKTTSKEIGVAFPHATKEGKYTEEHLSWWTNGFWPGLLWLVYRETKDESLKNIAEQCEQRLDQALEEYDRLHHDVGFMWTLTGVANYKITGNPQSKRRALHAANLLAGRFNIKGNFIRAWNSTAYGTSIIDTLMNLPLLHWATEQTGDSRFSHIAIAHADRVLEHFIRPDGSVHHIVVFDPDTGERIRAEGGQGYAPESAWSRGAAWAIYGLALSYRATKEARYLESAKKVSHFFIANLPQSGVPAWDFRSPVEAPMPTDTSAGTCAACGMLEIARHTDELEKDLYIGSAKRILKGIYEHHFGEDGQQLIGGGTGHKPRESNINTGLIYGDYYFAEAIAMLNNPRLELFW